MLNSVPMAMMPPIFSATTDEFTSSKMCLFVRSFMNRVKFSPDISRAWAAT
jgi:hypothetical protein